TEGFLLPQMNKPAFAGLFICPSLSIYTNTTLRNSPLYIQAFLLAPFKVGLTLFQECPHTLFLIVRSESAVEQTPLKQHSLTQSGFICAIDRLLDHHHHRQ